MLLLVLVFAWRRIRQAVLNTKDVSVTVIVPYRNEANNLPRLVARLDKQSHADFEVVFVNDHSEDQGEIKLAELLSSVSYSYTLLNLTNATGKKAAISHGIDKAAHDLLITTDADCEMGPEWLGAMSSPFENNELKMLVGPIGLTGDSFWQKMQSIESSAMIGVGGAMLQFNKPLMANGANLAYRKTVFNELQGFEGISRTPSGDDELLMSKVSKHYRSGIRFLKSPAAMVFTDGSSNWREFRQQRLRWASKWKVGRRISTQLAAVLVFLVQLIQLSLIGFLFMKSPNSEIAMSLLITRFLTELIFLWSVRRSLEQKMHWIPFGFNYLLYPFYAIYFGVAANFGAFEWKGRSYKVNNRK